MDPVKKIFSESFEDFQIPVGDALWQSVQRKRRPPVRRLAPIYRIAAAAAAVVLLVGVWMWWPAGQTEREAPIMAGRDGTISSGTTEGIIRPAAVPDEVPVLELVSQPAHPKNALRHEPSVSAVQPVPAPATIAYEVRSTEPADYAWVDAEDQPLVIGPDPGPEMATLPPAPEALHTKPLPPVPSRQPGLAPRNNPARPTTRQMLADLKPTLRDPALTGPQRLMAALETFRPRVVDDLIALGSRRTEIEISW
jgi:hypothetical protein